jgi:hypothetical protein
MSLRLTEEERDVLVDVLTSRLGELRQEIHHSTVSTYTKHLKKTEVVLKGLIGKAQAYSKEEASMGSG